MAENLLEIPDVERDVQRARLKSENLRWYISKVNPGRYGDRLDLTVTEKLDVSEALKAARARLVLPVRDLLTAPGLQVIESKGDSEGAAPDSSSVGAAAESLPSELPDFLK
jgi:hypothetical protein